MVKGYTVLVRSASHAFIASETESSVSIRVNANMNINVSHAVIIFSVEQSFVNRPNTDWDEVECSIYCT